jgi:hypothetical protein
MNAYDGRTGGTRNAEVDLERIRGKYKPVFDEICDIFDATMEHYCETLAQHLIRFQQKKRAIFADVVKAVGEERAHMALDEVLSDQMPSSLRRFIALIGIDSTPVPEPTSVSLPQSLSSPSISETSVTDTRVSAGSNMVMTAAGTGSNAAMLADVSMNTQATPTPTQQLRGTMSAFFMAHSSSRYSVLNAQVDENVHSLPVRV